MQTLSPGPNSNLKIKYVVMKCFNYLHSQHLLLIKMYNSEKKSSFFYSLLYVKALLALLVSISY